MQARVADEVPEVRVEETSATETPISAPISALEQRMCKLFKPPARAVSSPSSSDCHHSELASKMTNLELDFLNDRQVVRDGVTEKELIARFNKTQMDMEPSTANEYLENTVTDVVKDAVRCGAPSMIGHMTTSLPFYMRPLSKMVTTLHCNNVKVETGKSSSFLEKEAVALLHRTMFKMDDAFYEKECGRPDVSLGVVTSGGAIANNTAMWIARNKCLPAKGDFTGCDKQGIVAGLLAHGYKGAVIIGSQVMHYSMKKSADVLGIGTEGLLTVPFTDTYQVDVDAMKAAVEQCKRDNIAVLALCGVAGGTETGSVDNLSQIADLAEANNIHFHVDAAWGGPVIFSSSQRHKDIIKGIERADTVTIDGHKQLYTPMGCGLCMLKDPTQIQAVEKTADYIIRKDSYDLGKFSMEGSRPAVSLFLHANLEIMGMDGLGALVDRSARHVQFMASTLRATGQFEVLLEPMTNILLYRYVPKSFRTNITEQLSIEDNAAIDAMNVGLQNAQKLKGDTFVSRTTIYSPRHKCRVVALRVVIANPLTEETDIAATIMDQLEIVGPMDKA